MKPTPTNSSIRMANRYPYVYEWPCVRNLCVAGEKEDNQLCSHSLAIRAQAANLQELQQRCNVTVLTSAGNEGLRGEGKALKMEFSCTFKTRARMASEKEHFGEVKETFQRFLT